MMVIINSCIIVFNMEFFNSDIYFEIGSVIGFKIDFIVFRVFRGDRFVLGI